MADENNIQSESSSEQAVDTVDKTVKTDKVEDSFVPFEEVEADNKQEVSKDKSSSSVEIDDDDRKVMEAVIQDESKGIKSEVEGLKVDMKVNTFLADDQNQVYRPYADKIREYAKSPTVKGLRAEAIARLAVDPREMMAKGAEEERKAFKESRDSVSAGSTARTPKGSDKIPNAWDMSQEKFKEVINKVKRNL